MFIFKKNFLWSLHYHVWNETCHTNQSDTRLTIDWTKHYTFPKSGRLKPVWKKALWLKYTCLLMFYEICKLQDVLHNWQSNHPSYNPSSLDEIKMACLEWVRKACINDTSLHPPGSKPTVLKVIQSFGMGSWIWFKGTYWKHMRSYNIHWSLSRSKSTLKLWNCE